MIQRRCYELSGSRRRASRSRRNRKHRFATRAKSHVNRHAKPVREAPCYAVLPPKSSILPRFFPCTGADPPIQLGAGVDFSPAWLHDNKHVSQELVGGLYLPLSQKSAH
eukprot:2172654-Pyramimonas_sp.AAC.2